MYECFHCGHKTVVWQADFSFEEMMYEGEGIVHICQCSNCGAEIEYRVPIKSAEQKSINVEEKQINLNDLGSNEREEIWKDLTRR